ncbi:transposase [Paenibacillus borealis]|uniref:Transposase n=1 Tax=Paenibacillus borealis TaxID=160799 RepID=A0A089MH74_PAEBO|nr:transposase [Paenibacillus borealis]AIQ55889.1 transposase [Paenibacillus borealis]AIQ56525.1 transposase [Paenibacillus borealis]AIQ59847.1 transposase [Paenibacillus borealis]AIQ60977.1 transposase [Paenibacillus borealis]AIQ61024.1 transposase [Paenibacillus borealis]
MSGTRRSYNEEYKKQTVKYIQEQTKTVAELALELDIPAKTLHQWLGKYRSFQSEPIATPDKVRELERQLKERDQQVADLTEEMAILKKAVHIFSNPKN